MTTNSQKISTYQPSQTMEIKQSSRSAKNALKVVIAAVTQVEDTVSIPTDLGQRHKLWRDDLRLAYEAGRRAFRGVDFEGEDLSGLVLAGADFTEANLKGADLTGISAEGTVFKDVQIEGAKLDRAIFLTLYNDGHRQFSKVNLSRANLRNLSIEKVDFGGANLEFSSFQGSVLADCRLRQVHVFGAYLDGGMVTALYEQGHRDFRVVNLSGASLYGANLKECDFSGSYFDFADLRGADILGSKFQKASFYGAKLDRQTIKVLYELGLRDFRSVNFSYADLRRLNLSEANFRQATFFGANLTRTQFFGSNLEKANLKHADIKGIQFDERTNKSRIEKDLIAWWFNR